jgi:hypothetical protein
LALSACPHGDTRLVDHENAVYSSIKYESVSKAKTDLENPRDSLLDRLSLSPREFQYHTISGRVKDMTPRDETPDQLVKLVLTDGESDINFCVRRGYLKAASGNEAYADVTMDSYLKNTIIGDKVEVTTRPVYRVEESYLIIAFRNRDFEERLK